METTRLLVLALLLAVPAGATTNSDYRWEGPVTGKRVIEIRNINGPIHAVPSKDGRLEVVAIRTSRHYDPAEVKIESFVDGDHLVFCSVYPAKAGNPENTCDSRGSHNSSTSDVQVEYRVKVPAGVRFDAHTVNGDVDVDGLAGPVDAKTVNGEIKVSTASWAEAATVNGSVNVAMSGRGWPDALDFKTVNGDIVLNLEGAPDADLVAETMHGAIDSEFPLEVTGRVRRNRLAGTLGKGGTDLALATLNGSIELRRASR